MNHSIDFFRDEVRNGFYIPTAVKQAWASCLDVLKEVDRVCTKYGIKYFADWGSFLGAVMMAIGFFIAVPSCCRRRCRSIPYGFFGSSASSFIITNPGGRIKHNPVRPGHRHRRTVRFPAAGHAAAAEDPGGQRHHREGQDPPRAAQRHDPDLIILSAQKTASAPDDRRAGFLMRVLLFSCSRQRPGPARKPAGRMPPPI